MLTDLYDNPISTTSDAAQAAYAKGMSLLLAAQAHMSAPFEAAIAADPGFALGHAGLARALQFAGDMPGAQAAIATAQGLTDGLTPREAAHVNALALMIAGSPAAYGAIRAHVDAHPRDAIVAQTCSSVFGLIGFSGKAGREAETLAYTAHLLRHYGEDDWWATSQYAFALCETGRLDKAADYIDRSLALNPANANGAHVRSHVFYEAGDTSEGQQFLHRWLKSYDRAGMMHGHLSWHEALWALEQGDTDAMWALVDAAVTPPGAAHSLPINIVTDTASILHRAELLGVHVPPERWAAISAYAAQAFPKTGNAFVDVHAALAHAMAGNTDALQAIIDSPAGPAADLVPGLARAYGKIALQDWTGATADMLGVLAQLERLGGSRAQRDLVEHSLAACLKQQGKPDEAAHILALRRPVLADHAH